MNLSSGIKAPFMEYKKVPSTCSIRSNLRAQNLDCVFTNHCRERNSGDTLTTSSWLGFTYSRRALDSRDWKRSGRMGDQKKVMGAPLIRAISRIKGRVASFDARVSGEQTFLLLVAAAKLMIRAWLYLFFCGPKWLIALRRAPSVWFMRILLFAMVARPFDRLFFYPIDFNYKACRLFN